jgi:hypothetical protein
LDLYRGARGFLAPFITGFGLALRPFNVAGLGLPLRTFIEPGLVSDGIFAKGAGVVSITSASALSLPNKASKSL